MNLGLFLAIGESLTDLKSKGQVKRLINYNIKRYCKFFDKVYIFSYSKEKNFKLPKNCVLVANDKNIHRYPYSLLLPILKNKEVKDCDVLRGLQLTGGIPASVAKIFFHKNFVINYGYDYTSFAKIENKIVQSFFYKLIEKPILMMSNAIIVTSEEIMKNLSGKIRNPKLFLIPNGVDTKLFRPFSKKATQKLLVTFIGRLEKQKNLENLIIALKNINDIKAIFYGDGLLKKKLIALAKKSGVELKIFPPTDYEKIPDVLGRSDIFILPSIKEGNPKILLEAMSCAKAVVGSNVEGIRGIITSGENGLLSETDVLSISHAIGKLKNKKLRVKLGRKAREYIIKNYEINILLEKEGRLLSEIAKKL